MIELSSKGVCPKKEKPNKKAPNLALDLVPVLYLFLFIPGYGDSTDSKLKSPRAGFS